MIIKKFRGNTSKAAEAEALQKLGDKAIILNQRHIQPPEGATQDFYEVTAGVEEQENHFSPTKDYTLEEIEGIITHLNDETTPSTMETSHEAPEDNIVVSESLFSNLCASLWGELSKEHTPFEDLVGHLAQATKPFWQPKNFIFASYGLKNFLIDRGIDNEIAEALMKKVSQQFHSLDFSNPTPERDEAIRLLYKELTNTIHTFGPIIFDQSDAKVIALIGPSGVGKSTVAIKLASQYAQELNKNVLVISLENEKALQRCIKTSLKLDEKISLKTASTKKELEQLLKENHNSQDLIVIDAFNCSQRSWQEMDLLLNFLALPYEVEVHFILSALTKDIDAEKIFQHYSPLAPVSFILTNMEETVQPGLLVNMCINCHLPISYLSSDGNITHALEIADAGSLARKLLLTALK